MKIIKIKQYDKRFGYVILIKEFSKNDYLRLLRVIKKLGLARDVKSEKKMFEYGGRVKGNWIDRIYSNLSYVYIEGDNIISLNWKYPKIDGEEFVSLFLSN